jgi:DNA-binding NarL/FixJ family response regulator
MVSAVALRCLIVDDNPDFIEAARDVLERQGITVVGTASTGAEALDRAQELRPDVTLVDIDLGGESGFDVVERLAGTAGLEQLRLVLISTYAETDFAELIAASPVAGFVSKASLSARAIHAVLGDAPPGGGPVAPG